MVTLTNDSKSCNTTLSAIDGEGDPFNSSLPVPKSKSNFSKVNDNNKCCSVFFLYTSGNPFPSPTTTTSGCDAFSIGPSVLLSSNTTPLLPH